MAWVNPGTVTAGQVLGATRWNQDVVANTEFLAKPPSVRVQKSTEQSIPNAAQRSITWNTEAWDTDSMWSSTAPTRIDINTSGKYLVTGYAVIAASTAGAERSLGIVVDGSTSATPNRATVNTDPITGTWKQTVMDILSLTSTQFLRLQVYQDSGGALNITHTTGAAAVISSFSAIWISS